MAPPLASFDGEQSDAGRGGCGEGPPWRPGRQPQLATVLAGAAIEGAMRPLVARDGRVQVVGLARVARPIVHLAVPGHLRQVVIEQAGNEALAPDRLHRWPADEQLATVMVRRPVHG